MRKSRDSRAKDGMMMVSFKLSSELHAKLLRYAKSQTDESGKGLSPGQAARRLMLDGLKKQGK